MNVKSIFLGVGATLLSNSFLLLSSYTVKTHPISPNQIMTTSGIIQFIVFGLWSLYNKLRQKMKRRRRNRIVANDDDEEQHLLANNETTSRQEEETSYSGCLWIKVFICNLFTAIACLLCYIAVKMLPLSDYIVFVFTAPVFTLFYTICIMRYPTNFIKVIFCAVMMIGAGFVAQPTFIFGGAEEGNSSHGGMYGTGAALCFICASLTGFGVVMQSKCKEIPTCYYMFNGSLVNLSVGLVYGLGGGSRNVSLGTSWDIGSLVMVSSCSMLGVLFIQVGVKVSDPVLVSVTRTVEIVMALIVDCCLAHIQPIDYHTSAFEYKLLGSSLVMLSVVGIALSDHLHQGIATCSRAAKEAFTLTRCRKDAYARLDNDINQQ